VDDEYEIQVSVPLDSDGFLRRECPHCMRQFKWHNGPANEEAEQHARPAAYSCPLCGQPSADDSWNTPEQVNLIEKAAMPFALGLVQDELETMFRGMKGVEYKRGHEEPVELADPMFEPDDMTIVSSPCHGYEPVKVPEDHTGPLYCLICGSAFAV
jgi:endogenous inhibitor of DNA gyrase (YacG/DUF329 family)